MIYSMTGFGRGEYSSDAFDVTVELKSVNNRYCDITVKMPKKLNVFEDRIKNKIKSKLSRGRIDVFINLDEKAHDNYDVKANFDVLDKHVTVYKEIVERYGLSDSVDLGMLIRLQDGIEVSYLERGEDEYWLSIEPAIDAALEKIVNMRRVEGEQLKSDVLSKVSNIRVVLGEIEKMAPMILESYQKRVKERIEELLQNMKADVDETRLANELAIYADKTNINEEIVRIYSHLEQIDGILDGKGPVGRKLDFLIQELNREINTIGSKSPDFEISNYVIELKSEIEQIREQIQNLE